MFVFSAITCLYDKSVMLHMKIMLLDKVCTLVMTCYKNDIELNNFQNFVFLLTIDVSVFFTYHIQFVLRQTDIIPTDYWESNI